MNKFTSSKRIGLFSFAVLATTLEITILSLSLHDDNYNSIVSAQVVEVEEPPTNASEELDVRIYANEPLPPNGTIVVDISEAEDLDIEAIPPEGISIIATNTTVTVTNSPVELEEGGGEGSDTTSTTTGTTLEVDEEELEEGTGNDNNNDEDDIDVTDDVEEDEE